MIKTVVFDTDGIIIRRELYMSTRFCQDFKVPAEKVMPFFTNEFPLCVVGKLDLKKALLPYLERWNWNQGVEKLLEYWFAHETTQDDRVLKMVKGLRDAGIPCYLDMNNERYRTHYLTEKVGLGRLFDGIFSSADLGFKKPQIEFWKAVHDRLGKPDKKEVLVWDDDEANVQSAREFGFNAELYSGFEPFQKRMSFWTQNSED